MMNDIDKLQKTICGLQDKIYELQKELNQSSELINKYDILLSNLANRAHQVASEMPSYKVANAFHRFAESIEDKKYEMKIKQ